MTTRQNGGDRDDNDVFEELYREHVRGVIRFFMRVFHVSEQDAKDLAQTTFARILEHMKEYRGDAKWAYVETVARNVGYNHVRSLTTGMRGAIKPANVDDPAVRVHEQGRTPDYVNELDSAARMKAVKAEIERLPAGQRQCLLLSLSGLSYKAIAASLGISVDAVKSRLRDARNALRERLGANSQFPEDE